VVKAWLTGVAGHHSRLVEEPDDPPVARDQPVLHPERLAGLARAQVRRHHALAVVRMQDPEQQVILAGPLLGRVAQNRLELRARVDVRAPLVQAVDVDGQRELLDQRAPIV
jgi:hypothetical protein